MLLKKAYGVRALADYDFSKAEAIVSVDADFLADWQGGGYDSVMLKHVFLQKIMVKAKMSKHFQFEANMTLSGANADFEYLQHHQAQKNILAHLYAAITGTTVSGTLSQAHQASVDAAVAALKAAGNKAVVVSGIQDKGAQALVLPSITH